MNVGARATGLSAALTSQSVAQLLCLQVSPSPSTTINKCDPL